MADNTPIVDASSVTESIATDELATLNGVDVSGVSPRIKAQRTKIVFGSDGIATDVDATHALPVDASGHAVPVTDNSGSITVDDGGLSLTVDGTVAVTAADGSSVALGTTTDVEATANGSVIAILKRLRTLLNGGLPAALGANGGVKVEVLSDIAAARTTDSISAALATDAIMSGLTALTPTFAPITASASGVTTVVAAVASKKIRILGGFIVCTSAVSVNFQSHTTTTTKTGTMPFGANGGVAIPFSPVGWFETVAGEALDINLGGAVAVGGQLVYVTV